ncbi:MAG: MBL fold metallo-hydrolase [Oscillatoriales cyanobacterium C42_A2020_001]|nr:MBL fold metallo-hydrolase [Leptolyngbyaceae cyanobacterium C42_A2020_001]
MKRRWLMCYGGAGLLTALGMGATSSLQSYQAQTGGSVSIQWFGHTCFLFTGGGAGRILVNPFRTVGCTAGYRAPKVNADLVMISSQLLDEGAVEILPGNPKLLFEAGSYQVNGRQFQGIRTSHDLLDGKRFGINVAWRWKQGGIDILHLGGAAAPITPEQKILMGRPDLLLIPVGNGPKAYTPENAKAAIEVLNPKIVIPTHYRTRAAKGTCDLVPVDNFLSLMSGVPIRRVGNTIALGPGSLPKSGTVIQVMSYPF